MIGHSEVIVERGRADRYWEIAISLAIQSKRDRSGLRTIWPVTTNYRAGSLNPYRDGEFSPAPGADPRTTSGPSSRAKRQFSHCAIQRYPCTAPGCVFPEPGNYPRAQSIRL